MVVMIEKTIPTAALALVPSSDTKNMSAMPYTEVTSMVITVGMAIFATSRGIGIVSM